ITPPPALLPTTLIVLHSHRALRHLHSFPTRRSSDLPRQAGAPGHLPAAGVRQAHREDGAGQPGGSAAGGGGGRGGDLRERDRDRSEEHTSELQSRFDLVCRLLLEKKKEKRDKNCKGV